MSQTKPTVDVVVPVYGNWEVTRDCLESLRAQTREHRAIVVDDASPDDTPARVREHFPEVDLVVQPVNGGFAAACNAGIRHGSGDVVVLLNNDVEAAPDMLELLAEPFAADPSLGAASPMLLRPDGRVDAYGICADPTLAGFVRGQGRRPEGVDDDRTVLLGPYGAGAAYRRRALEQVGLLDERIFMYGEELDLAIRLRAGGWPAITVPAARGVHLGGATAGRGSSTQRYRGGFGRGYLLRAYGVLRSRQGPRALLTEAIVCAGDLVLSRDAAAFRGRLAGWRAGRQAEPRPRRLVGLDTGIGFVESLRMRRADYSAAGR